MKNPRVGFPRKAEKFPASRGENFSRERRAAFFGKNLLPAFPQKVYLCKIMQTILEGAGWFIWPLGFCSVLAMAVIVERFFALRESHILPRAALEAVLAGNFGAVQAAFPRTIGGRIVDFALKESPDAAALAAYARMEVSRMERGMFIPESIVSIAPLIGLFGTVYGLFILFPENGGMPDQQMLVRGVGLALTTTMLGLLIAMPVLLANNYIMRRVEVLAARLSLVVECLNNARETVPADAKNAK